MCINLKEKKCKICGKNFVFTNIRQKYCVNCKKIVQREYKRKYRQNHREEINQKKKIKYKEKQKNKIKKIRIIKCKICGKETIQVTNKKYCETCRKFMDKIYTREQRLRDKKDINKHTKNWCRKQIHRCLNFNKNNARKDKHTFDILGYTTEQLISRIEMQFKPDMNWNNHGTLWHIDHRKPLDLFNFIDKNKNIDYHQVYLANCLANLKPLYWWENISKFNKIESIK